MRAQRIRHRMLLVVLLAIGWSIALSVPAGAAIDPGDPGDGIMDFVLDPSMGSVLIDTDGVTINSYVLSSDAGIFTDEPANNLGFFQEDSDFRISGSFAFTLLGVHSLGNVIGPEWDLQPPGYDFCYNDLTGAYTIEGTPGTFVANLIVIPEPTTVALLALGSLVALRRKRQ